MLHVPDSSVSPTLDFISWVAPCGVGRRGESLQNSWEGWHWDTLTVDSLWEKQLCSDFPLSFHPFHLFFYIFYI